MADKQYRVVRPHEGDRFYAQGDVRTLSEADAKHLVPKVLVPLDAASGAVKVDRPLANKMDAGHANKAGSKGQKA